MRKMLMLALLVLGTGAFANVKPVAAKGAIAKESTIAKHKKAIKKAKRVETVKNENSAAKK